MDTCSTQAGCVQLQQHYGFHRKILCRRLPTVHRGREVAAVLVHHCTSRPALERSVVRNHASVGSVCHTAHSKRTKERDAQGIIRGLNQPMHGTRNMKDRFLALGNRSAWIHRHMSHLHTWPWDHFPEFGGYGALFKKITAGIKQGKTHALIEK